MDSSKQRAGISFWDIPALFTIVLCFIPVAAFPLSESDSVIFQD